MEAAAAARARGLGGSSAAAETECECSWRWTLEAKRFEVLDRRHKATPAADGEAAAAVASSALADEASDCILLGVDKDMPATSADPSFLLLSASDHNGKMRCAFQMQPLRLILHQTTISFLRTFMTDAITSAQASPNMQRRSSATPSPPPPETHNNRPPSSQSTNNNGETLIESLEVYPIHVRFDVLPDGTSSTYRALLNTASEAASTGSVSTAIAPLARMIALRDVAFHFKRLRLSANLTVGAALEVIANEWQPQLLSQLHHALQGLPGVRSVMHLSSGLSKLLLAPLRPAPLRGIQRGSTAFARSVAVEGLGLTAKVLEVTQLLLEQLHALLTAAPLSDEAKDYCGYAVQTSAQTIGYASEAASSLSGAIDVRGSGR